MNPRRFSLYGGLFFLVVGVLALIPSLSNEMTAHLPYIYVQKSYGVFLNMFPMNIFNKVALIGFGLAGLFVNRDSAVSLPESISFSRWVAYLSGALTILGLFPATNTLFGYWPLFGADAAFHGAMAVVGAYFGFALSAKVPDVDIKTRRPAHPHGL